MSFISILVDVMAFSFKVTHISKICDNNPFICFKSIFIWKLKYFLVPINAEIEPWLK